MNFFSLSIFFALLVQVSFESQAASPITPRNVEKVQHDVAPIFKVKETQAPIEVKKPFVKSIEIFTIDERCDPIAKYSRAVASLRELGIGLEDLSAFTSEPVATTFPMRSMRLYVFTHKNIRPSELEKYFKELCMSIGYNGVVSFLEIEEIKFKNLLAQDEEAKTAHQKKSGPYPKGDGRPDPRIISGNVPPRSPNPEIIAPKPKK